MIIRNNSSEYTTVLSDSTVGFDVSAYRNVNKIHLLKGSSGGGQSFSEVFSAYYKGGLDLNTSLEIGSFGVETANFLNSMTANPITRTLVQSFAGSMLGANMSASFAANYVPFIKSVAPLEFTISCELPIAHEDEDGDFVKNILKPINALYEIYLPDADKTTEKLKQSAGEAGNDLLDAIFSGTQGIGFFDAVQKAWQDLGKNMFSQVFQLSTPQQFNCKLNLWIGERFCIEDVMIKSVNVKFSPLIYIDDDGNVAPAYAKVDIGFLCKKVPLSSNMTFK